MKTYNQFLETPLGEDKKWIQKATKNMRKDKPCTGEKFGSETCPPGSKRYNLAKTFRKMAKEGVKYYKGDDRDPTTGFPKGLKPDKKKPGEKPMTAPPYNLAKNEEVVHEGDYHSGQGEKIQKRTKKWMEKKGKKGAPGLDAMKERQKEHKAKRGVKEEIVTEADGVQEQIGGMTKSSTNPNPNLKGDESPTYFKSKGKALTQSQIGAIKSHETKHSYHSKSVNKGYKPTLDLRKEDKAFEYVKKQIAAKYGKSGYVSKDNPRKPQTAAEKKKARDHQAKVDKENAAARAKDPSQGRYPKG